MRFSHLVLSGVVAMPAVAAQPVASTDRVAIERIVARQAEAWNRHDMHAFVADMMPDVDWINIVGMHWRGRETVERAHAGLHRLPLFANSRMVPGALELRALSPDVILAVEHSRVEGAGPTSGGDLYASSGTIGTFLFVRSPEGWRIAHGHNTSIDERASANDPTAKGAQ